LWLQWQRLNTPEHRERLDGGARVDCRLTGPVSIPYQLHIVHEGGQLYAAGPVRDSLAMASGVALSTARGVRSPPASSAEEPIPRLTGTLEVLALWSHDVPDRQQPQRTRDGAAFLGRGAIAWLSWRGHLLFWRGDDFTKDEGDANYQSLRRDGARWRGIRDYAEAGLTRTFRPARGALIETSFRYHRIEDHYEYSYRILAVIDTAAKLR